jgi:hypothetical protein
VVDKNTGHVGHSYASANELDGYTYVRCGNRRAAVCPSCSRGYKGDAWHVLMCGLAGGKGIPASVAEHPCTFATLTAPSFGPVHGLRDKGPAGHAATNPCARTGVRPGAASDIARTTRSSASRCAASATTTPRMWCGSGTPLSCGAG